MESIKINEYVRIQGDIRFSCVGIGKVINIVQETIYVEMSHNTLPISFKINQVVNHSKNIMELIEYGDLVKFKTVKVTDMRDGKEREFNFVDAKFCDGWSDNKIIYDMDYLIDKDQSSQIEWVLTREQISNNRYKV